MHPGCGLRAAGRKSIPALAAVLCAAVLTVAQPSAAGAASAPNATDTVPTMSYGSLGTWMLQTDCQFSDNCGISDWLGHPYHNKDPV